MNEPLMLALAWVAGLLLGVIFLGGLWWTVYKGLSPKRSGFWYYGSLLLRVGLTLVGFYFVGRGHWDRLLMCLFGFLIARFIVMRFVSRPARSPRALSLPLSRRVKASRAQGPKTEKSLVILLPPAPEAGRAP